MFLQAPLGNVTSVVTVEVDEMHRWPIHEAKARLSEPVRRAHQLPQQLTSHGEPVAVVLSAESYHRHRHEGESLVAFIRRSPLVGVDELDLERSSNLTRDLEL